MITARANKNGKARAKANAITHTETSTGTYGRVHWPAAAEAGKARSMEASATRRTLGCKATLRKSVETRMDTLRLQTNELEWQVNYEELCSRVFVYDHVKQAAVICIPEDGSLWPVVYILARFHRKHNILGRVAPKLHDIVTRMSEFTRKTN